MDWQIIVALVVMIPIILVPVLFIWFLNLGGLYAVTKRIRERRAASSRRKAEVRIDAEQ